MTNTKQVSAALYILVAVLSFVIFAITVAGLFLPTISIATSTNSREFYRGVPQTSTTSTTNHYNSFNSYYSYDRYYSKPDNYNAKEEMFYQRWCSIHISLPFTLMILWLVLWLASAKMRDEKSQLILQTMVLCALAVIANLTNLVMGTFPYKVAKFRASQFTAGSMEVTYYAWIPFVVSMVMLAVMIGMIMLYSMKGRPSKKDQVSEDNIKLLLEYKKLLDQGIISNEEFQKKKEQYFHV